MFTGIIENLGTLTALRDEGTNRHFTLISELAPELKVDQSVAHDGVCLTVVEVDGDRYTVTAVEETLLRTQLGDRTVGDVLNLERCTKVGDRLDGHIVQGHVDTTATVTGWYVRNMDSWNARYAANAAARINNATFPALNHMRAGSNNKIVPITLTAIAAHFPPLGFSIP